MIKNNCTSKSSSWARWAGSLHVNVDCTLHHNLSSSIGSLSCADRSENNIANALWQQSTRWHFARVATVIQVVAHWLAILWVRKTERVGSYNGSGKVTKVNRSAKPSPVCHPSTAQSPQPALLEQCHSGHHRYHQLQQPLT